MSPKLNLGGDSGEGVIRKAVETSKELSAAQGAFALLRTTLESKACSKQL
jgi:hypothetical protein